MSQATTWNVPTGGENVTATQYATRAFESFNALLSKNKGPTAPSYAVAGADWIDDSAAPWVWRIYDGADWIDFATIDPATNEIALVIAILSPPQIAADQNDYNPADLGPADWLRLSTDATRTITGLAAGRAGEVKQITNVGANAVVLAHQSALSAAANRFISDGNDLWLMPGASATVRYDATSARWRVVAIPIIRASVGDVRDGGVSEYPTVKDLYDAAAEVALTSTAGSVAWNLATGINFTINPLAENTTISFPTNVTPGKSGYIRAVQDATGSRLIDWANGFVFRGGAKPIASTVAGAEDVFSYICLSATAILIVDVLDAKAAV